MSAVDLLHLWYTALAADVGLKVQTLEPERLRQQLYKVRKGSGDPALDGLSLVISPIDPEVVWIVKRKPEHGEAEGGPRTPESDPQPL